MPMTVAELAQKLGLTYEGQGNWLLTHACGLEGLNPQGISYVENKRYAKEALASAVQVFICHPQVSLPGKTRLLAEFPALAIVRATELLHPAPEPLRTVHSSLILGSESKLGTGLTIAPNVVIGERTQIGENTIIMAGVVIGNDCHIGANCLIHPNVTIRDDTQIGSNVIINSGAVLGADGYGFVTHQGKHYKIPQVGYVVIEDDVEIGACNTIDRGRFGVTRIARGTKLDNLVHVGHNVEIGEDSLIVGMVGFAGSTKTGHHLIMGGQSMLTGHLEIGNHVTVSAKSMLAKSVGDGERYSGIPARPHREWLKANGALYRMLEIWQKFRSSRVVAAFGNEAPESNDRL